MHVRVPVVCSRYMRMLARLCGTGLWQVWLMCTLLQDGKLAQQVQQLLAGPYMRVNTSTDVTGVEICGALKNVLAIAAGIVQGLELGNNAMAALLCQVLFDSSCTIVRRCQCRCLPSATAALLHDHLHKLLAEVWKGVWCNCRGVRRSGGWQIRWAPSQKRFRGYRGWATSC